MLRQHPQKTFLLQVSLLTRKIFEMLIILKNKFNATYNKIIHWRKSQFLLPSGSMGKRVFEEMTRIITRWTFKSEQDTIAMKVQIVLPTLLIQKKHPLHQN